jgi:hypothetical protein
MLAHSFFMGLATVLFETAASALFLARFGSATLPYVYVAAALVNVAIGAGYARLQGRMSFARLMTGTLWLLAGTTIALRAGLSVSAAAALTFALLVWYRAVSILTDLEYWAVAARLFDVREAKRLFPVIGSGEVVARVAGSFAVPFLVAAAGVENLLVVAGAALFACLGLVGLVLRDAPAEAAPAPPAAAGARGGFRSALRDRYLATLVGVAALGVLAKYLVDFAFLEQMRSRYADAGALASTFAVFSGVTQALSLATRATVAGPLLRRHGVRAGLLVLPLAHVACTALVILAGWAPAADAAVFWLVLANQGIYKTLKHPIDNPSFKVLYQPLARDRRLATQIAVETIVTPVTIGLAGGLMLLFTRAVRYDPTVFAWAMLAAFAAWAALGARAGREYAAALLRALRGRIVDDEPFAYGDARSLAILKGTLASDRPGDVLFALELLEKAGDPGTPALVAGLVGHPAPEVRRFALARVTEARPAGALAAIARMAMVDTDAGVRSAALRSLAVVGGPEAWPVLESALDAPEPEVRRGALAGLLAGGAPSADPRLRRLAESDAPAERARAARLLGEAAPTDGRVALLARLIADRVADVRRAALQSAGRLRRAELWTAVAGALADPACRTAAVSALGSGGDAAIAAVTRAPAAGAPAGVLRQAARVAGRVGTAAAGAALAPYLGHADPGVREEALLAMRACGHAAGEDAIRPRIRAEVETAALVSAALRDLDGVADGGLLHHALESELAGVRRRVLLLLAAMGAAAGIQRVGDALDRGTKEKRAYAVEALDVALPGPLRPLVLPVFEDLPAGERSARLGDDFPQPRRGTGDWLGALATSRGLSGWTRACAARAGGSEEGLPGGITMQTIEKVISLKAAPMFAEASEEILADVAAIVDERVAKAGEVIIRKGEAGDGMYVIVRGRVRVFDGERTITHLGERDIFGELALLDPEPRAASVQAVEDTRLFRLDREGFAELMAGNIEIVRGVLHVLCERLRRQSAAGGYAADLPEPPPVTPPEQS